MNWIHKSGFAITLAVILAVGIVIGANMNSPAAAQGGKGAAGAARYTVVETEGVHLIVTDNEKNTVFFYTVDEGQTPGSDLHLRGTIDLNSVGAATIKPTLLNPKK